MFSHRMTTGSLIELCRSMRFSLTSGLMLRDAMEMLSTKGTRPVRPVAEKITRDLKAGWGLQDALQKQETSFPPLFLALTSVGEESGTLPEVLAELEKYYEMQQKLRREFVSEIAWPVFQFCFAMLVVSGLIYVLGILSTMRGQFEEKMDPLGMGLLGAEGSVIFLSVVFGTLAGVWGLFLLAKRLLRRRAVVERMLLYVPGIGPCLRGIALTRFCVALRLMLETNLSVMKTLRLALLATDNAAFTCAVPAVTASLRQGNSITNSLTAAGIFPENFLSVVGIAEECGRLPETLQHQADQLDELTRRRLALLNRIASWLVWLSVALFIVFVVFRIFINMYYGNLQRYLPE